MDFPLTPQSGDFAMTLGRPSTTTTSQITTFADQNPAYKITIDSQPDATFDTATVGDDSLAAFFSRPIKIASYNWPVAGLFFEEFDPWSLFFQDKRVINRVSNFNLLRAKLNVKIVISGNAFYFGRILASYHPLATTDFLTRNRGIVAQDAIAASQRPHFFIDPTTSQGGEMVLPFFWKRNYLNVPVSEWNQMGKMSLRAINLLLHLNASDSPVNINVFAWATEVQLAAPTSIAPDSLVPQSSEYATGPISAPASAISKAAGALTSVPGIAPYARATEKVATTVSKAATAFGYSRPAIIDNVTPVNITHGNFSQTNTHESVQRLTLDARQELSIDPRTVGLSSVDEMSIQSIATRESYLDTFSWSPSTVPEVRLWNSLVDPMLYATRTVAGTTAKEYHLTAMAYAALPFDFWRGTLRFRFQIVAAALHRGRLKIVYDPFASIGSSAEYNTAYTYIVDIGEERDFTIDVGWGTTQTFRQTKPLDSVLPFSVGVLPFTHAGSFGNGILSVFVVNSVTSPNDDNTAIYVNVFVSAADNFEVARPSATNLDRLMLVLPTLEPQAGEQVQLGDATTDPDMPYMQPTDATLATDIPSDDSTSLIYFGETVTSFRQILRRYCLYTAQSGDTSAFGTGAIGVLAFVANRMPGLVTDDDLTLFHFANTTFLSYVRAGFAAYRGSVRWKLCPQVTRVTNPATAQTSSIARVIQKWAPASNEPFFTARQRIVGTVRGQNASLLGHYGDSGFSGSAIVGTVTTPIFEFEMPHYTNDRFENARSFGAGYSHSFEWQTGFNGNATFAQMLSYVSVGEDFSTFFFLGAPLIYATT